MYIIFKRVLLFSFIICLTNCRTLTLNQTAKTLEKNKGQSQFYYSNGVSLTDLLGINLALGYFQRFGVLNNFEVQFSLENQLFYYFYYASIPPGIYNYLDLSFKHEIYEKNNHNISILYGGGIYGGWNAYNEFNNGIMGPVISLKFIGSQSFVKSNGLSLYYGVSFQIKNNFLALKSIQYSLSENYPTNIPFINFDIATSLGWEVKRDIKNKTVVIYHELNFTANLITSFEYYPENKKINTTFINNAVYTLSYSISIPREYWIKKK